MNNTFNPLIETEEDSDELINIFDEMTVKQSDNLPIKYINRVPKICINEYETIINRRNPNLFMFIDTILKKEVLPILNSSSNLLQQKYKLFWINQFHLNNLIQEIIQTTGKYVYPMIFVNYLKQSLSIDEKINFDNSLLLYIRIWSNQIREIARQYISNSNIHCKSVESFIQTNSEVRYIGYKICCELLYYYKFTYKHIH